jgi:hypothetical protein
MGSSEGHNMPNTSEAGAPPRLETRTPSLFTSTEKFHFFDMWHYFARLVLLQFSRVAHDTKVPVGCSPSVTVTVTVTTHYYWTFEQFLLGTSP